ncbi:MAG: TatD family hydrolase [Lachnospiraceae bacterium]
MALFDGHAHLGSVEERNIRSQEKITTMVCAGTPKEAKQLEQICSDNPFLIPAYGLHPWHSEEYSVEDMDRYLKATKVIGEIGMDNVWCQVPLEIQRKAFEQQLALASERKQPVVLHTKGQEKAIGTLIAHYPNRYLVHWYSSMEDLDLYLSLDCYFTIGPDAAENPAVVQVIEKAPLNRLLVETDGWGAVQWALGDVKLENLPGLLRKNMELIAAKKQVSLGKVERQLEENFWRFMG